MKISKVLVVFGLLTLAVLSAFAQLSAPLPGRVINKMLPDYLRPRVYALNKANGSVPGTLLALNPTNGAILAEISLNLNPTDMAVNPTGDALFVIQAGSRTISKVDLNTFTVAGEKSISTPSSYDLSNPLYLVAGQNNRLFYTDGAWGPQIYAFDFLTGTNALVLDTGGNGSHGAGALALNKAGDRLYIWQQYGWSAGNVNAWVRRFSVAPNGSLTTLEDSFTSWRRDPLDTPIFLDGAERWVFNKQQMFSATNVSVLVNQFANNIYGISLDGSIAFGPSEVFNTVNGNTLTNLPFATTVQTLSGDQKRLFRYQASSSSVVIYDMASIATVSGPSPVPTPADGAVVSLPLTNLSWTISPMALAYDVYLGTSATQVGSATNGSAQYLGRVTAPSFALPGPLNAGINYYWRVDVVGFSTTNAGPMWSFTTSTLSVAPAQINQSSLAGYNPASISLALSGSAPVSWTAAVKGANWISVGPASGTSPGTVTVDFNTAALAAGLYTNTIEFAVGATVLRVPISLTIKPLNITKMVADTRRPYIYAIQPPALSGQSGLLLFINTSTGNIDKALNIGVNPVDLSISRDEGKLYVASWTETWTYVVDLQTQTLLPSLNLGTDVYKINAGRQGLLVTEGMDQWVYMNLINTTNGQSLASGMVREGDGDFDPTGRFYYHVDNNSSGAAIYKYDTLTNTFASVTANGTRGSYYGSRNLVMSADGSRLFWTRVVYDANLVSYDMVPGEVYSCSTNGRVAFGATQAYDTVTRQAIYNLPVSSTVSVVDGQNQRFWYFANGALGSLPMSAILAPTITSQPAANTSVILGGSVYLTVTAMGISPISYQWTLNGTNVAAQTNYFLSIPALQASQAGDYRVVVANDYGAVTSSVAQVNVLIPPAIVAHPAGTNVTAGQSFSLMVSASGSAPFTYRWLFENSVIGGATSPTLTISNAQSLNEGIYRVVVGNSVGSVTSSPAFVRVAPSVPVIITPPVSLTVGASSNALFSVQANGSQNLVYQWYFNDTPLPGAAGPQLSLTGVQANNAGNYWVVVSNSIGRATSSVATLTVVPVLPYFTLQPVGDTVVAGSTRTLLGAANGSQPIAYRWQRNGTNLPSAQTSSLTLSSLKLEDSGDYTVIASNAVGYSTSMVAKVTVYQNATLLSSLTNRVVQVGDTLLLSASAGGTAPLLYSWQFNGQTLPATNASLLLTNVQLAQSGFYRVAVTNSYGSVFSTCRVSVVRAPAAMAAWGDNSGKQADLPQGIEDVVAVAGGDYHTIALRRDGTLLGWGFNGDGQSAVPTNVLRFVDIAAGGSHNLAITEAGGVVGWGRNDYYQRTVPANVGNNVLSVAAGDAHSLALLSSGTVVAWGDNSLGQCSLPQGLSGVRAIAAGHSHNLAVRTNGTVVSWGFNLAGQATVPAGLTNVVGIAGGYLHSAALKADGTVVCWGDNSYGQTSVPAGLSNVVAISAGVFHTYALRTNGVVVGWGDDSYGQLAVPTWATNNLAVSSGFFHGLALMPALHLNLYPVGAGVIVEWTGGGVLQSAPTPSGPFTDVPNCAGSYTNTDLSIPARYFRLKR